MTQSERKISKLLVVTGSIWAGKSLVIQSLEDIGFLCGQFANIIAKIVELMEQGNPSLHKVAIAIDLRGKELFTSLVQEIDNIKVAMTLLLMLCFRSEYRKAYFTL